MGLFGFSLSNLFGKTVKHSSHKHHSPATKTHRRKPSNKRASKKNGRRSRKYKMRGGWGGTTKSSIIPTIMKGGWCSTGV